MGLLEKKVKEMRSTYLHYENEKGYDVIDFIKDYKLNFNRGNIVKYVTRSGRKDDELKDLEKAADYLRREIEYLREKQQQWIEENK